MNLVGWTGLLASGADVDVEVVGTNGAAAGAESNVSQFVVMTTAAPDVECLAGGCGC